MSQANQEFSRRDVISWLVSWLPMIGLVAALIGLGKLTGFEDRLLRSDGTWSDAFLLTGMMFTGTCVVLGAYFGALHLAWSIKRRIAR